MMKRRRFLKTSSMGAGGLAALSRASAQDEDPVESEDGPKGLKKALPIGYAKAPKTLPGTSELVVSDPSSIKILQFTDVHFYCDREKYGDKRDRRTLDEMRKLVDLHDPHLVAVTGDLWHDNPGGRGQEFFEDSVEKIAGLGKPWVFTWGDHDLMDDYA